jgi:hypothetical protein
VTYCLQIGPPLNNPLRMNLWVDSPGEVKPSRSNHLSVAPPLTWGPSTQHMSLWGTLQIKP